MKNSEYFEKEKLIEIEKLSNQNQFIEAIKEQNIQANTFSTKVIEKFEKIFDKNKKYLHKLESNEFEIAIVGLEKAGKSTFANALIENYILPSAPERCTFTATRLIHGNDKAMIEFYNEAEFNEIFQQILLDIEYPDAEIQSYKSLSLEKFKEYFDALEESNPNLYKSHIGKTDKEIEDILSSRERLTLTGKIREFFGDELTSENFQEYIRGENKGTDTSKPRSVKSIEIQSSKLKKLENAIIYDVPGFDSPTKIHERQTVERLKKADAIILVTNVGRNPSLVGTQLNIITKNSDADGIPLRDKLFVFGNQLDTANSQEESKGNIETLVNDVSKYKIGEIKRVFTGSALKFLAIDNNIINNPDYKPSYEFKSGINEIFNELVNYYENERFEILKRKIDSNEKELTITLDEILEKSDTNFDVNFSENEKNRIIRDAYKKIENNLEKKLKELKSEFKKEIWNEEYFSKKFTKDVENQIHFKYITNEDIKAIKIYEDESLTLDTPIEKMNQSLRKKLHKKFLKEFSNLIIEMTDEKSREIEIRILRAFTSAILDSNNSSIFNEIEKESEQLILKLTSNISHNKGRFTYLIERFSRDIFDILISHPLLSEDRKDKFKQATSEFIYLDNYYNRGDGSLINMLLIGENRSFNGIINSTTILKMANQLISWASNSHTISGKIKNITEVGKKLAEFSKSNNPYNISEILENKNRSITEDLVLKEINQDIENLRDILKKAIVPAISLETAFLNSIDKQIKILIDSFSTTETEESKVFNSFISKIVPKVKSSELNSIEQKLEAYKAKQALLKNIKEFKIRK